MTKRLIPRLILFAAAFFCQVGAIAQNLVNEDIPEGTASLFRGTLSKTYPFRYNGTFYWNEKGFQEGSIMYNGKLYKNVYLNVDAYQGEVLVSTEKGATPIVVFRDQVAWLKMGDMTLLNLRYLGYPGAPEGFLELVRDGQVPLLRQVRKVLSVDGNDNNGAKIGYFDPEYDTGLHTYFKYRADHYALEDGNVTGISKRQFKKALKREAGAPVLDVIQDVWHPAGEYAVPGAVAAVSLPGTSSGLPSGYFEEVKEDTTQVQYAENTVLASYKNKVYTIGSAAQSKPGKNTVTGVVIEYESGEPMSGVLVFDQKTSAYARTDSKGRYKIQLPSGENVLNFSMESKEELTKYLPEG